MVELGLQDEQSTLICSQEYLAYPLSEVMGRAVLAGAMTTIEIQM
jgi:hypothetical protein